MTIKELMEHLSKQPPEYQVYVYDMGILFREKPEDKNYTSYLPMPHYDCLGNRTNETS